MPPASAGGSRAILVRGRLPRPAAPRRRPSHRQGQVPQGHRALRHACASLLIAAGESVKVVSERLGHTSAAMTLNVYSHLFPESEECAPDVPPQSED
ncbi:tyrosine-type recombinase/integrase [Streptomyces sp. NPDC048281]|uniref:tyrosine-type recombinase/integrase n=1 Tax=Streptomyces sp. NPDC048281 TaxID=3154715 RepID=UPI00341487EB